ncbi:MAG TPA: outer membrane beta-barrel protein [Puia sp.]|nr:outer membrane beta-barrel protein [Puia sp.]
MFNLSDKELDRLSREAADAYEVDKTTSSWEALEKRLDAELGIAPNPHSAVSPPRSTFYPIAYTSLIILIIGTGYFLTKSGKKNNIETTKNFTLNNNKKQNSKREITEKETAIANNKPKNSTFDNINADPRQKSAFQKGFSSTSKNELSNRNISSLKKTEKKNTFIENGEATGTISSEISPKEDVRSNAPLHKSRINGNKNDVAKNTGGNPFDENTPVLNAEKRLNRNAEQKKNKIGNLFTTGKPKDDVNRNISGTNFNKTNIPAAEENEMNYSKTQMTSAIHKQKNVKIDDSALLAEAANINKQPTRAKSLNTNRSLEIGISFGPDYSKAKYAYTDTRLGSSVGITVDYHLLRRLSVNTALIYAHKYYEMDGDNFHPRTNAVRPPNADIEFVKGSFKMIEIPLNLRYDISSEDNTSFFVNAGVSSYLIQNENNNYFCHYNLGPAIWINQQPADAHQNFWFSTLNVSGGFETYLSNSISFQLEPYIKLPLKKIGAGNVSLSSYGITMGIKYSPALKKSRR